MGQINSTGIRVLGSSEKQSSNIKSIGDFVKNKHSTNLEILKYLNKTKETEGNYFLEINAENSPIRQSFEMRSRKPNYEEKISSSKF